MFHLSCQVNDAQAECLVNPAKTLLEVLREDLQLTGTKHGCELGECGACAVLVDGQPVLSCLALAVECNGRRVTTVEGLAEGGQLHPLQEAFADLGSAQCGYCTPAMLLTAKALLDEDPNPSRDRIREALSGNLCRCTGYLQIIEAVEAAAEVMAGRQVMKQDASEPRERAARTERALACGFSRLPTRASERVGGPAGAEPPGLKKIIEAVEAAAGVIAGRKS